MLTQSKGKIFLAEERGLTEVEWFRSYNTFNFGGYFNEHKLPFGALYVVNEDTLSAGRTIAMEVAEGSVIMLIPVTGAVACKDSGGNTGVVEAGRVLLVRAPQGMTLELSNPFDTGLVTFLQVWFKDGTVKTSSAARSFSFDLEGKKGRLTEMFIDVDIADLPVALMGKFMGREEAVYQVMDTTKGIFAFVIEGVFEVQHRLLHPGDGLALWDRDHSTNSQALW